MDAAGPYVHPVHGEPERAAAGALTPLLGGCPSRFLGQLPFVRDQVRPDEGLSSPRGGRSPVR